MLGLMMKILVSVRNCGVGCDGGKVVSWLFLKKEVKEFFGMECGIFSILFGEDFWYGSCLR